VLIDGRPGVERVGSRDMLVGEGGVESVDGEGWNNRFLIEGGVSDVGARGIYKSNE
jgi:hypothetical protein